jgi:hypothetical protein
MDKKIIARLEKLGINTQNTTVEIFEDLLNIAEHLSDELEVTEEMRFKIELERLSRRPTN